MAKDTQGNDAKKEHQIIKASLCVLTYLSAAFFLLSWNSFLATPYRLLQFDRALLQFLVFFTLSASLFLCFDLLLNLLLTHQLMQNMTYLLIALSASFFSLLRLRLASKELQVGLLAVAVVSGLVVLMALFYFAKNTKRQIQEHLRLNASHVFGPGIGRLSMILMVVFTLQYYAVAHLNLDRFQLTIPDYLIDSALGITEKFFGGELPGLGDQQNESWPMLDTNNLNLKSDQELLPLGPLMANGPSAQEKLPGAPAALIEEVKAQLKTQMNEAIQPYKSLVPLFLAFLLFATLFMLNGMVDFFSLILFRSALFILRALKIVETKTEMVEAQRVVLK